MIRLLALAPLALLLAACEGNDPDDLTVADTGDAPAISTAPAGQLVATLAEWQLALSTDTVPAGNVTIQVMNRGLEYHRFELEGAGGEWVTDSLGANGETLMQMSLQPGTYVAYCPIVGPKGAHRELGMVDTLVVR